MTVMNRWLVPMAVLGVVATGLGLMLCWLALTRPVELAQTLGGVL